MSARAAGRSAAGKSRATIVSTACSSSVRPPRNVGQRMAKSIHEHDGDEQDDEQSWLHPSHVCVSLKTMGNNCAKRHHRTPDRRWRRYGFGARKSKVWITRFI